MNSRNGLENVRIKKPFSHRWSQPYENGRKKIRPLISDLGWYTAAPCPLILSMRTARN